MAITENTYTGDGSTVLFPFTFEYIAKSDVKVSLNGTLTDAYSLVSETSSILFDTAPDIGVAIRIYRDTNIDTLSAEFFPGSAIRAEDLNNNFTQNLYVTQEVNNNAVQSDGSIPFVNDISMGGYKITNLADPVASSDAATRNFVENALSSEIPVFYRRLSKTAAGGETSLSGNDDNGISLSYVAGSEKVFINGALQVRGVDYTGTTGTTLTGIPALTAGDIVEVHSSSNYTVATVPDGSVTNAKVDGSAAIQYSKLALSNSIVNADVNSSAGIQYSKLNLSNSIVDADVNSSAGIVASKLDFTQSGTGAVQRTVESKLQDVVSVKDFGAVGDGSNNDRPAIAAAISAASANGAAVYFPPGEYFKAGTGSGQAINVPAGTKLIAHGDATIKCEGYPILRLNAGCEVSGVTFDSTAGGVSIGLEIFGNDITVRNCTFKAGSQLIYLYTADRLLVDGCRFEQECGYQILQKIGSTSNDCRVVNCTSVGCKSDFVELNSEGSNPCKNWLISGNFVKNLINPSAPTSTKTECRFFGATATDGVVITNNIIDTIAGDSAIHCEGETKNLVVSDNIFINCHSQFGKIAFFPGGSLIDSFHFSSNIVRYTSEFTAWTSEGSVLIQANGNDASRLFITNNTFTNESAVSLNVASFGDTEDIVISGNRVVGFNTAFQSGFGATGSSPRNRRTVFFNNNVLESCTLGCSILETSTNRHYRWLIDDNVFVDVTNVYTSGANSMPESLTGNSCRGATTIDEAKIIGNQVSTAKVRNNWVDNDSTTTKKGAQNYTSTGVAKTLFTAALSAYGSYQLHVKATNQIDNIFSPNSRAEIVRLDYNSPIDTDLTTIATSSSGTGAGFTLALSVTGAGQPSVTFSATANRAVKVSLMNSPFPTHTPDDVAS